MLKMLKEIVRSKLDKIRLIGGLDGTRDTGTIERVP